MALFSISNARVAGMAACVPQKIVSNYDYNWVSKKERQQFIKRVGVETKRAVKKGQTTSDLCFAAAERLINDLGWKKDEIDVLIFISQTGDYLVPGTAGILQDRLGLPMSCMAFDINLGCTAFVYGLSVMGSLLSAGKMKKGLLLMGEISSLSSYRDKSTYPLMGDAGTATAMEYSDGAADMHFNLQSEGAGYEAIIVREGGAKYPFNKDSLKYRHHAKGIIRHNLHAFLDGNAVFQFCIRNVVPNINGLLSFASRSMADCDYLIMHQANKLINEALRKKLKLGEEKVPYSLDKYGNTSSASIPLTIVSELRKPVTEKKLNLLVSGFGVGLSLGSVLFGTDKIVCPEVLELN